MAFVTGKKSIDVRTGQTSSGQCSDEVAIREAHHFNFCGKPLSYGQGRATPKRPVRSFKNNGILASTTERAGAYDRSIANRAVAVQSSLPGAALSPEIPALESSAGEAARERSTSASVAAPGPQALPSHVSATALPSDILTTRQSIPPSETEGPVKTETILRVGDIDAPASTVFSDFGGPGSFASPSLGGSSSVNSMFVIRVASLLAMGLVSTFIFARYFLSEVCGFGISEPRSSRSGHDGQHTSHPRCS